MTTDYLKIGSANDLSGKDRAFYRLLEIFPGVLSWLTLIILIVLSYTNPEFVAYILIAFDVYWLLLVIYLGIHLVSAYRKYRQSQNIDRKSKLENLSSAKDPDVHPDSLAAKGKDWKDIIHLIFLPNSYEGLDIIRPTIDALIRDGYPTKKMVVVFATEERAGIEAKKRAETIEREYASHFLKFIISTHPDGLANEIKGKGANQAWAARFVKEGYIDKEKLDYDNILVSVFDIDTIVLPGYFSCLTHKFLSIEKPYRASYQPVPLYHNNIWEASFFARVAASSNTFWQMMQQIRQEKLATYSSHSMTWRALSDVDFWSTNMVSEDSRIFWHCYCFYNCDYRVEPLNFPVSMDATEDKNWWSTAKNLYKQQRRWGWGIENLPYLIFNAYKKWDTIPKKEVLSKILIQLYGFHSWATNALIIGIIGWLPLVLGGDSFNSLALSINLPTVTRTLMTAAMSGLILSAIISTLLLPERPKNYTFLKNIAMLLQWIILPFSIIIFGAIPGLEAQTRLILGKRLGFQVTPKGRQSSSTQANWDQK